MQRDRSESWYVYGQSAHIGSEFNAGLLQRELIACQTLLGLFRATPAPANEIWPSGLRTQRTFEGDLAVFG